jgi:hypothetical protein
LRLVCSAMNWPRVIYVPACFLQCGVDQLYAGLLFCFDFWEFRFLFAALPGTEFWDPARLSRSLTYWSLTFFLLIQYLILFIYN